MSPIRSFPLVLAAALLLSVPATAQPLPLAQADPLEYLTSLALEENPDLRAAKARWNLYERRIVPARSLDDPQLSLAVVNYPVDSLKGDETPMSGKDVKLAQKLPFPGKLATKGEMAKQRALWFKGAYGDARIQIVRKVKNAYYRLFALDKGIEITEKNLAILGDFTRLTETRYEVGKGLQQDVLKAHLEQSKLLEQLISLRQKRVTVLARLNRLLNRSTDAPLRTVADLVATKVTISRDTLEQRAEKERPLYDSYRSLVERFKSQRKLAKLNYRPDFTLWGGYRFRQDSGMDPVDGEDFVSAGVSINLPIYFSKRREAVAEAESSIHMALSQFDEFRNGVNFSIQDAYAQVEKNRDLISLFETGIIPQANQTFQASLTAYQVDKVDFLSLLDSLMKLYRYEIDYYRSLADHQRAVADLEAASGVNLIGKSELSPVR